MAEKNVGGRDRLARGLLAAVLRCRNQHAQEGEAHDWSDCPRALGFGLDATTCFCGMNEALGIDTTTQ